MKKILKSILMITAIMGLCAIAGSECPGLTDAEATLNLSIGAALFFGSACIYFLIKREG